ncbi:oxidase [Lithospermum erythrorhizon]|uniref:L-aspartate oxidase n=1 Tax=Lithospermum erythrorhizon TaxID=34254 RepID=A0AAV3PDN9_LITER
MKECKPVNTPVEVGMKLRTNSIKESINSTLFKSLVGSLRYLTFTRPDIMYAVGLVSRYIEKPKQDHFITAKKILRYIKGTLEYGLFYTHSQDSKLVGYLDSDYGGDLDDAKSTSGYAFHIGLAVFSWSSKKQQTVPLSTCEAEYMAVAACTCQAIWLKYILSELYYSNEEPVTIYVDNKSSISLAKNPVSHSRSKHINIKYHFLRKQDGSDTVCHGVDTLDSETHEVVRFISKVTLLASGGAGHIYPSTTNPPVATGDGIAMAHRAQAVISNMEFVQFHLTALADEGLPLKLTMPRENSFLISEGVRGDGGFLFNLSMERLMPSYDKRAELAPRDVVARSIDDQLKKRKEKYVLLDISHKSRKKILSHFPNIAAGCLQYGLDITQVPIPVVPAAHYMCGGVRSGIHGETNVRGLFVAGEVACTGLHGANHLASNSLLEALVFARRAVQPSIDHKRDCREEDRGFEAYLYQHHWEPTMVGLEACEMRNLFCCAKLVVRSSIARRESSGLHIAQPIILT